MTLSPRAATVALIAVATALRLVWAAVLPATTDDAYHCQYAVHPALSYFDHPPMTMLVAKVGLTLFGGWIHPFALRFGFVLMGAGTSWFLFRWTARCFGDRAGLWAVLGFSVCHYPTAFVSACAVTDAPHYFFAILTGWLATEAVFPRDPNQNTLRRWLLVGLAFGGALLSKYHTVLIPAGVVLYALVTPGARRLLRSPGPYLAVVIGFALFSPVIYWNATHEWASFQFQGGRMSTGGGSALAHGGPLVWLVGPIVFLLPWMWFWLSREFVARAVGFSRTVGVERFLFCLSAIPMGFFFFNSFLSGEVLPHWPLAGFLPLFPLAGARWAGIRLRSPKWALAMAAGWVAAELALIGVILLQVNTGRLPLPEWADKETRICSGWESVTAELKSRGLLDRPDEFLVTNLWENSAHLAFGLDNRIRIGCFHSFDARGFAFWSKPADYVGLSGHLLTVDQPDDADTLRQFAPYFGGRMWKVGEFPMLRGETLFRVVRLYRCENMAEPYPFDFRSRKK